MTSRQFLPGHHNYPGHSKIQKLDGPTSKNDVCLQVPNCTRRGRLDNRQRRGVVTSGASAEKEFAGDCGCGGFVCAEIVIFLKIALLVRVLRHASVPTTLGAEIRLCFRNFFARSRRTQRHCKFRQHHQRYVRPEKTQTNYAGSKVCVGLCDQDDHRSFHHSPCQRG